MFRADPCHTGVNDDGGTRPSGALVWSRATGDRVYSSPAVVDGVVYIGSDDQNLYALDAENGAVVWNYTTGGRVLASPAVDNGIVYSGSYDNNLYALDKNTGLLLWTFQTGGWVTSSPVVTGGVVYSGSLGDRLYALDAHNGTELWNVTFGEYPSIDSSPAVCNGLLYVTGDQTTLYALDAMDGTEIWNFTTGSPISSSPAVADGILYVSSWDGNAYALDTLTGQEIWRSAIGSESEMDSSPAVADGVVYIGSNDNNVYALDALTGEKIWNYTTGSVVYSSPTLANGIVYVGSWDHTLYALDAETGEQIWNYPTGSVVYSSPAVSDGRVYFGSFDGNVYALGSSPGTTNLMLGKLGPVFYENASMMDYSLFYRNQGNSSAENVVLKDFLPPSVEYLSGSGSPVYDETARTVTWDLGSIPPLSTGTQSLTVRIPSSVAYGTVLNNTANITTSTPETQYGDNIASTSTTLKSAWTPPGCSITPSVPDPWGTPTVYWRDPVMFSYNQTLCSPDTPVNILFHIDDGGPDIAAPMTGGPQYWNYTATFYPRYGSATVTYETPGCIISGITFPFKIEPAGYIYDSTGGQRIEGAEVWLQWPDDEGNWVNVPTGLATPPMTPDQNPLTTGEAGLYQWDVEEGSYRVWVEADGYSPAASTMVNSPPQLSGLDVGLAPTTGKIWVTSTPFGAAIFLDGSDTGFVTSQELAGITAGDHTVELVLAGYMNYTGTVTVTAGKTTTVNAVLSPLTPVANFTANETFGFVPLTVQFIDSSTGSPPMAFQWDFGDGSPNATEQNPVHTYTYSGTYNVTLTVSNSAGSHSFEQPGYIRAMEHLPPIGGGKAYYLVHSNVDGAEVYFNGDWFEGTIQNGTLLVETCTTCTPVWTYTVKKCGYFALTQNNTRYPAKDEVVDLWANLTAPKEPLIADFTANVTDGAAPLTVGFESRSVGIAQAWNWSFGDGTYSEEENPVHTYTSPGSYTVSLHETNTACQDNTMVKPDYITVGGQPLFKADFTVSPVTGSAPLTVHCIDRSVGNPSRIVYNFGDGFTAKGPDVIYTYRFPGTYTITETISKYDPGKMTFLTSVARKPGAITVFRAISPPPEAAFTASPMEGPAPLTVSFSDESSGNPTYYTYDFGDGFKSTTAHSVHTYRFPGTYKVTLTILRINSDFASLQSSVSTGTIVVNRA
ncbi:PKD repeat protein/outer membrane protein assembly factor BamB [Methanolinea mesophila]|uniref:outer membrane protein assembly factor BamB family protein n=1 Tax=Methanolinea mesophila TaxID=547055 RepID=UPI001AE280A0|nr:PQQ-binding-like beta-propeller repeat protein [Methanolinea mesophila]MBP1929179.1 PKD repeat protein/outer membrane protein assembly factor BamB [Methanolinea mesophila]